MKTTPLRISIALSIITIVLCPIDAAADNIGHTRHHHTHNDPHPVDENPAGRFITNRTGAALDLPVEDDAFMFAIFGDRTGGPPEGVSVLADAVRDTNLIEPDFVMTVGDLVQGYNQTDAWMQQMREFKSIMDKLLCPWFPVAGNHDIYWRGPDRPANEHEDHYEMHFGPLWYAFEHKGSWFIVLYSDEGNPQTRQKSFQDPAAQTMSDNQFNWLHETLSKASDATHVFVFLHHPRWLRGGYGDDWDRVHELLVDAGNVRAVFAGHIHRMRYDPKDGIEYVTLATVGGAQHGSVPQAGYLHQFHLVTVRDQQIAMAAIPVGQVMDVREITGKMSNEIDRLTRLQPTASGQLKLNRHGRVDDSIEFAFDNPASRPLDFTVYPDSADSRWTFTPDHTHFRLEPGESRSVAFNVQRHDEAIDWTLRPIDLVLEIDYLGEGFRYDVPDRRISLPLSADIEQPSVPAREIALSVRDTSDCLVIDSDMIDVPDGPLTVECWFRARSFGERVGLVTKTENSEYGLFVSNGTPEFFVFIGGWYLEVAGESRSLETDRWHHIAGVYDGKEARLYLNGELITSAERVGERRTNDLPFIVGADVDRNGRPTSPFDGLIDAVHVSATARYSGESFEPIRRPMADDHTRLLLNMDAQVGAWLFDESPAAAHPMLREKAELVEAE